MDYTKLFNSIFGSVALTTETTTGETTEETKKATEEVVIVKGAIDPHKEDKKAMRNEFNRIVDNLNSGELVARVGGAYITPDKPMSPIQNKIYSCLRLEEGWHIELNSLLKKMSTMATIDGVTVADRDRAGTNKGTFSLWRYLPTPADVLKVLSDIHRFSRYNNNSKFVILLKMTKTGGLMFYTAPLAQVENLYYLPTTEEKETKERTQEEKHAKQLHNVKKYLSTAKLTEEELLEVLHAIDSNNGVKKGVNLKDYYKSFGGGSFRLIKH